MGMDVSGKNPTAEAGEYFRNNCWWWPPLADYACEIAPDVTAGCEYWGSNDGDGLEQDDAEALAVILRDEIASGRCAEYAEAHEAKRKATPRKTCFLCNGSGVRADHLGIEHGQTTKIIPAKTKDGDGNTIPHPRAGQVGWCNGCDGRGDREGDAAHYPFSVENVAEFATFLEGCGGFEIW